MTKSNPIFEYVVNTKDRGRVQGTTRSLTKAGAIRSIRREYKSEGVKSVVARKAKNPSRSTLISSLKGALRGAAGRGNKARQATLKARLKRARTPQARPKGRLPNPITAHVVRSSINRKAWKVWVTGGIGGPGWLRIGFAWKTQAGATAAAKKAFPGANIIVENSSLFGPDAVARAKKVTKIRPIIDRDTGDKGEIIGTALGGYVKVKWKDRAKATLIKRTEIKRGRYPNAGRGDTETRRHGEKARGSRYLFNPGPLDIVYGLQAYDYISKRKIKNPKRRIGGLSWHVSTPVEMKATGRRGEIVGFEKGLLKVRWDGAAHSSLIKRTEVRHVNPSVRALSQKFQGRVSGAVKTLKAASSAPSDLARIGKLILLRVQGMGRDLKIPGAVVAASASEKLWIAGTKTPMLNRKAKPGELLDFGPISKIVYLTAKDHIGNGQTFEYDHDFESPLPHLCVDHEGMPIIRGGGYSIRAEGITG